GLARRRLERSLRRAYRRCEGESAPLTERSTMTSTTTMSPPRVDSSVRLIGLTKTYPNGPEPVAALQGVTLEITPGAITAVMGPSGSGKSTFLNLAAGLDTPSSGQVFIGDTDITTLSSDAVTRFRR